MGRYKIAADQTARGLGARTRGGCVPDEPGQRAQGLGHLDAAADTYREALAIEPADTVALNNLANLLTNKGARTEAIECYQRALVQKPDDPVIHNNLGNAMAAQGRSNRRWRCVARWLSSRITWRPLQFCEFACGTGQLDAAIARYRHSLALCPSHLSARNNLGSALRQTARFAEAIDCYQQLLARRPDNAEAHSNLGRVFMLQGRLDEAVARYEHALVLKQLS